MDNHDSAEKQELEKALQLVESLLKDMRHRLSKDEIMELRAMIFDIWKELDPDEILPVTQRMIVDFYKYPR